jgi:hypothetical protein
MAEMERLEARYDHPHGPEAEFHQVGRSEVVVEDIAALGTEVLGKQLQAIGDRRVRRTPVDDNLRATLKEGKGASRAGMRVQQGMIMKGSDQAWVSEQPLGPRPHGRVAHLYLERGSNLSSLQDRLGRRPGRVEVSAKPGDRCGPAVAAILNSEAEKHTAGMIYRQTVHAQFDTASRVGLTQVDHFRVRMRRGVNPLGWETVHPGDDEGVTLQDLVQG